MLPHTNHQPHSAYTTHQRPLHTSLAHQRAHSSSTVANKRHDSLYPYVHIARPAPTPQHKQVIRLLLAACSVLSMSFFGERRCFCFCL
jgi:hypothetical protein